MIPENFSATGTALANHLWQSTLFAFVAAGFTLALRKNQASLAIIFGWRLRLNFSSRFPCW